MRFFNGVRGIILWYVSYISIFENSQLKYFLKGGMFESNQIENHLVKGTFNRTIEASKHILSLPY